MGYSSKHRRDDTVKRRAVALTALAATAATVAALVAVPADAGTTVGPTQAGDPPFTRDSSVTLTVDPGGLNFTRSTATANFAVQAPSSVALSASACKGDNPAGTHNTPFSTLTVTGPGSTGVVLDKTSPVRDLSLGGLLSGTKPLATQPAPNNTNYRGGLASATTPAARGWQATLDLTGKPAGVYTVTTTTTNMVKTGTGACTIGTPAANGTAYGNTFTPGPKVETQTFEYRPWQYQFKDILGAGSVLANSVPKEFRFSIGSATSAIVGAGYQRFYTLPGPDTFLLPSNPEGCAGDPSSCLPSAAAACDPATGCVPRLMVLNKPSGTDKIQGVFDLQTKAFIALVAIGGTSRELFSLGTTNDASYAALIKQLSDGAAKYYKTDLPALLATTVLVKTGSSQTSLSLLNGLQIDAADGNGVQIKTDPSVQAGVILDIYANVRLTGAACATNVGDSDPNTAAPDRFTRKEDAGYSVTRSELPSVPAAGPAGPLASGPLYQITGSFASKTATPLVNTASTVIGVDTSAGEPNGYPVWVSPFLSPLHTASPKTMEFLGTATWSASEKPLSSLGGCTVVDYMLGTGVAVYNNPTGVTLSYLTSQLFKPSPAAASLTRQIDGAVQNVVTQASSNPAVNQVLTGITAALPLS